MGLIKMSDHSYTNYLWSGLAPGGYPVCNRSLIRCLFVPVEITSSVHCLSASWMS
jgi:hypothetical protein